MPPVAHWHGIEWREGETGAPLLEGALGWIECRLDRELETGDHTFFVGAVESVERGRDGLALVHVGATVRGAVIEAVVFDLDGVIVDSEHVWDDVATELWPRSAAAAGTTRPRGT